MNSEDWIHVDNHFQVVERLEERIEELEEALQIALEDVDYLEGEYKKLAEQFMGGKRDTKPLH